MRWGLVGSKRWARQVQIYSSPLGLYICVWGQTTILPPVWRDSILMFKEKQTEWLQTWYAMVRILWNCGKNCSSHIYYCFPLHFLSESKESELKFEFGWIGDIYLNAWWQSAFDPPRSNTTTTDLTRNSNHNPPPPPPNLGAKIKFSYSASQKVTLKIMGIFSHTVDLGSVIRRNQMAYFGHCKLKNSINLDFF
jgi:hypothetical protein